MRPLPALPGREPRHGFSLVDHVRYGEHRMPQQHARTGPPHDGANLLPHLRAIAMDHAVTARRLGISEDAALESSRRVLLQLGTRCAQATAPGFMAITTIEAHHRLDRLELARTSHKARVSLEVGVLRLHNPMTRAGWARLIRQNAAVRTALP